MKGQLFGFLSFFVFYHFLYFVQYLSQCELSNKNYYFFLLGNIGELTYVEAERKFEKTYCTHKSYANAKWAITRKKKGCTDEKNIITVKKKENAPVYLPLYPNRAPKTSDNVDYTFNIKDFCAINLKVFRSVDNDDDSLVAYPFSNEKSNNTLLSEERKMENFKNATEALCLQTGFSNVKTSISDKTTKIADKKEVSLFTSNKNNKKMTVFFSNWMQRLITHILEGEKTKEKRKTLKRLYGFLNYKNFTNAYIGSTLCFEIPKNIVHIFAEKNKFLNQICYATVPSHDAKGTVLFKIGKDNNKEEVRIFMSKIKKTKSREKYNIHKQSYSENEKIVKIDDQKIQKGKKEKNKLILIEEIAEVLYTNIFEDNNSTMNSDFYNNTNNNSNYFRSESNKTNYLNFFDMKKSLFSSGSLRKRGLDEAKQTKQRETENKKRNKDKNTSESFFSPSDIFSSQNKIASPPSTPSSASAAPSLSSSSSSSFFSPSFPSDISAATWNISSLAANVTSVSNTTRSSVFSSMSPLAYLSRVSSHSLPSSSPSSHSPSSLLRTGSRPLNPPRNLAAGINLPEVSSYWYMPPQQARTGWSWSNVAAPYGIDGMRNPPYSEQYTSLYRPPHIPQLAQQQQPYQQQQRQNYEKKRRNYNRRNNENKNIFNSNFDNYDEDAEENKNDDDDLQIRRRSSQTDKHTEEKPRPFFFNKISSFGKKKDELLSDGREMEEEEDENKNKQNVYDATATNENGKQKENYFYALDDKNWMKEKKREKQQNDDEEEEEEEEYEEEEDEGEEEEEEEEEEEGEEEENDGEYEEEVIVIPLAIIRKLGELIAHVILSGATYSNNSNNNNNNNNNNNYYYNNAHINPGSANEINNTNDGSSADYSSSKNEEENVSKENFRILMKMQNIDIHSSNDNYNSINNRLADIDRGGAQKRNLQGLLGGGLFGGNGLFQGIGGLFNGVGGGIFRGMDFLGPVLNNLITSFAPIASRAMEPLLQGMSSTFAQNLPPLAARTFNEVGKEVLGVRRPPPFNRFNHINKHMRNSMNMNMNLNNIDSRMEGGEGGGGETARGAGLAGWDTIEEAARRKKVDSGMNIWGNEGRGGANTSTSPQVPPPSATTEKNLNARETSGGDLSVKGGGGGAGIIGRGSSTEEVVGIILSSAKKATYDAFKEIVNTSYVTDLTDKIGNFLLNKITVLLNEDMTKTEKTINETIDNLVNKFTKMFKSSVGASGIENNIWNNGGNVEMYIKNGLKKIFIDLSLMDDLTDNLSKSISAYIQENVDSCNDNLQSNLKSSLVLLKNIQNVLANKCTCTNSNGYNGSVEGDDSVERMRGSSTDSLYANLKETGKNKNSRNREEGAVGGGGGEGGRNINNGWNEREHVFPKSSFFPNIAKPDSFDFDGNLVNKNKNKNYNENNNNNNINNNNNSNRNNNNNNNNNNISLEKEIKEEYKKEEPEKTKNFTSFWENLMKDLEVGKKKKNEDLIHNTSSLSNYEQKLLDEHNSYRSAAGLTKLQWNDSLSLYIRNFIEKQDMYHECQMVHSPQPHRIQIGEFKNIGENLYTTWKTNIPPKPERVVQAWYNEIYCYRYGYVGKKCTSHMNDRCAKETGFTANPLIGHFTQLMWSSTTHVGCAMMECKSFKGQGKKYFAGCSYGSSKAAFGGNLVGQLPFDANTANRLGLNTLPC